MGSTRRSFTDEYKESAVGFVLDEGRSIKEVARNIGAHEMTVGKWVKKERDAREATTGSDAWNLSQTVPVRSSNTTSTTYQSVASKVNYGAPTGGTWTGATKVSVDVAWAVDQCGTQTQGQI